MIHKPRSKKDWFCKRCIERGIIYSDEEGPLTLDGHQICIHVASAIVYKEFDPESGKQIRMTCGNEDCLNPEHMEIA